MNGAKGTPTVYHITSTTSYKAVGHLQGEIGALWSPFSLVSPIWRYTFVSTRYVYPDDRLTDRIGSETVDYTKVRPEQRRVEQA